MVPDSLFYHLLLVALVLIFLVIHVWWPNKAAAAEKDPYARKAPARKDRTEETADTDAD